MDSVDCLVVGAGVVGLAVARALALAGREVLVAEAESAIGTQTSSRNSEVIHAGIYYPTGSLKARLCVAGRKQLYAYCAARDIAHRRTGKLIVAATQAEIATLQVYKAQATANGVDDLAWLRPGEVAGIEPAIRCEGALFSPSTGIVDSHALMLALQADLEAAGGHVIVNTRVTGASGPGSAGGFEVRTADGTAIRCRALVNSAGLRAPELAARIGGLAPALVPAAHFAIGHYFSLQGASPFRHLVYPVAARGGLGIHVTLDLGGRARFGPDLAWIDGIDYRFDETRRAAFCAAIRRYYPALDDSRLQPAYTGIRPKISGPDEPSVDFLIQGEASHGLPGLVNLFGIESPGLTAALAIGDSVTMQLMRRPG